ncbi:Telomerase Cajal body protein 1 [Boothiomyces sp. JEL0838]|nr:Telomerase Cajal body protein 1 [Boothiomyces sp. JEL0838]
MNNFYSQILFSPCRTELLGVTEYNELILYDMNSLQDGTVEDVRVESTANYISRNSNNKDLDHADSFEPNSGKYNRIELGKETKKYRIGIEHEKATKYPDQIYSLDFYPFYNYSEQHKCFIISVKDHPPVLYDSTKFYQRQVYKTMKLGEHQTPLTVKFNYSDIYCGFKNYVSVFDINGTEKEEIKVQGLISCMDFGSLNLFGSFNGLITMYQDGYTNYIKEENGITQIKQKDYLIIYSMRNGGIAIYDTRNMSGKLVERKARNQRLYFDLDQKIVFGDLDGNIKEMDFDGNILNTIRVDGTVSSVQYGNDVIAYSVGTREFIFDQKQNSFIDIIKY